MLLTFLVSSLLLVLTNIVIEEKIHKQYKTWKGRNKTAITADDRIIHIEDEVIISFELEESLGC